MQKLSESLGFDASQSGNKWRVKVIQPGWGSSGYYSESMLAEYGPKVFTAGTKVFMNHPSMGEATDRPERDVHQLAGKLTSDAVFQEDGLYADIQFYSHYAPIIKEMANDVGLSIHALGSAITGEAEGRKGPIIESLTQDPLTSVDVVTVAGAGGKFVSLLESYSRIGESVELTEETDLVESNEMSISKEEFEAAIADLKTAFVEALTPVVESVSILAEAAKPVEIDADAEVADVIDPVDVAEKFNESGLPKVALTRVAEALKSETNTKTVDELITDEKAYADAIRAEVKTTVTEAAAPAGNIQESAKENTLMDEFDAIVARHVKVESKIMALNEVYAEAESLVLPVASTVVSGQAVIVGGLYGVALKNAVIGEDGNYYTTVKFNGVFRLSITGTLTVGQQVYITSAGALTTTATSNTLFGHAIKAKTASGAGDAWVRIFGC